MNASADDHLTSDDAILEAYGASQGPKALRLRTTPQGEPPWPDTHNPMLAHLIRYGSNLVDDIGVREAMLWVAVHSWYEGGIAQVARSSGGDATSG